MRQQIIESVEKEKLIAIVRGVGADQCRKVAQALYEGGVRLMEITYDQRAPETWAATAGAIGALAQEGYPFFGGRMTFRFHVIVRAALFRAMAVWFAYTTGVITNLPAVVVQFGL